MLTIKTKKKQKKLIEKTMNSKKETKTIFERINKIDKPQVRLIREKDKIQIRNERSGITTYSTDKGSQGRLSITLCQ